MSSRLPPKGSDLPLLMLLGFRALIDDVHAELAEAGHAGFRPLHGVTFKKGLGVHAPSEIDYYLGGTCSKLTTSVGIDDDVQGPGSVVFQIYVDHTMVADSGLMTTTTPTKTLAANLSGADTLKLVVTDGGDGIEYDHADWAEPVIECL